MGTSNTKSFRCHPGPLNVKVFKTPLRLPFPDVKLLVRQLHIVCVKIINIFKRIHTFKLLFIDPSLSRFTFTTERDLSSYPNFSRTIQPISYLRLQCVGPKFRVKILYDRHPGICTRIGGVRSPRVNILQLSILWLENSTDLLLYLIMYIS